MRPSANIVCGLKLHLLVELAIDKGELASKRARERERERERERDRERGREGEIEIERERPPCGATSVCGLKLHLLVELAIDQLLVYEASSY
jgi:hypothetical protein